MRMVARVTEEILAAICIVAFYPMKWTRTVVLIVRKIIEFILWGFVMLGGFVGVGLLPEPLKSIAAKLMIFGTIIPLVASVILFWWREDRFMDICSRIFGNKKEPH